MRTFTIRAHRAEAGEADVDFVLHGDSGPTAQWARRARPGDQLGILGARGFYLPPEGAEWQPVAGDEAALPAIGAIVESMPPTTRGLAFVEVAGVEAEQPLAVPAGVRMRWAHRDGAATGRGDAALDAVRRAPFPEGRPYAWVAGEARAVKMLRRHLVDDRGIDQVAITFMGYWRVGKTETDESTPEELEELERA